MEHRVALPSALSVHSAKYLFEHSEFFPECRPERIVLAFHPKFTRFEPFAVAMLAAWARYWTAVGVPIRCENVNSKGVPYAQRLGLFKYLPDEGLAGLEEHEPAGRFVTLKHITKDTDLSEVTGEIGSVLRDRELIRIVQHALSEMSRNVMEHSNVRTAHAEGFLCAQYYPTSKHVSIGVADCGRGIRDSLRQAYGFETDEKALLGALRPGVSGRSRTPYSAPDNAGLGLFVARALAKAGRQYFMLTSGDAAYRLNRLPREAPSRDPDRNPAQEKHALFTGLKPWTGTVVAINLRGTDRSFDMVMQEISHAISDDDQARYVRSRIRFTP